MLILGIDPGTRRENPTGWALLDTEADKVLHYGLLKPENNGTFLPSLSAQFDAVLRDLMQKYSIDRVAIESPYLGKNARTVIILATLHGAYRAVAALYNVPCHEIAPVQAKAALAGTGRATKYDMIYAAHTRYGIAVPEHVADAIGMALADITWEDKE